MKSYVVTPSGDLKRISDDHDPAALAAYGDWLEQGERDLVPIQERLDALSFALAEGWCPPRVIENEIDHLNSVIAPYHCAKYLNETLRTLQDGEADLAIWQQMPPAARDERWAERDRADAEAAERRKARQEAVARKNAIYEAARRAGMPLSPELEDALAWACQ
jgi:hypothetical protein